MAYLTIEGIWISHARMTTILIVGGLSLYGFATYALLRLNKFERPVQLSLVVILYLVGTFFWFWIGGINGPSGIGIVIVVCVSFIFVTPRYRMFALFANLLLVIALTFIHMYRQDLITYNYLPYFGFAIDYLAIAIGMILMVYFLKREVDIERKTIRYKNEQLLHLNENLKSTVDEQRMTLRKLSNTQNQLVESEKMASIGKLTAGLAHELNNPLNFVGGVVTPLKKDIDELTALIGQKDKDKANEMVEEINLLLDSIENGTERASQVIKRLLNITPRGNDVAMLPVNLSDLILDVCQLVKKSNEQITLREEIQPNCLVLGNPIEINQVLLNLLRNSIQAIPENRNGEITISCQEKDKWIQLLIQDNGVGMNEEAISQAFEAFYTTKEEGVGTGLGLFITYGIIQKHKGRIDISSTPDIGTKIEIHLPVA